MFVVVGNKLENVALLFSSHLSFSSKFAEKPILVVCMYCSFARLHFTSLYETGKKFAHIQDLRNCYTLFYLLLLPLRYYVYGPDHLILLLKKIKSIRLELKCLRKILYVYMVVLDHFNFFNKVHYILIMKKR